MELGCMLAGDIRSFISSYNNKCNKNCNITQILKY